MTAADHKLPTSEIRNRLLTLTTVHDLAADWTWMESHSGFLLVGSHETEWEQAEYGSRGGLKVSRVVPDGPFVKTAAKYVNPKTRACLVEARKGQA